MNEDLTKLLTILVVFIIGMVSAGAVILTINTSNDGDSDGDPILPEPVNQLPLASMFTSSVTAHPYEEITFDASSSTDPDGTIVSYLFDFGDDTTPLLQEDPLTTHSYKITGEYYVDVEVTDTNGTVNENVMEIMIIVEEEIPQEVITTSSRSIDDFDEAFETVDASPLAAPPDEENPVGEEDEHPAPDIPVPDLNFTTAVEDPEFPELDTLEIEDPEMDLEFGELDDENAGYEAAMDWEDAEEEFIATMDENQDADEGIDNLEADPVTDFQEDFGTFRQHRDSNDTEKHFSYRSIQLVNVSVHDGNDDGNPESSHTQTVSYEAIGSEENPRYESFYSSEVRLFDNNSDGIHNYLRINQFGFESVDMDGDGNAEYSLISLRVIVVYDNNTDGNPELEAIRFEDFVAYRNDTSSDNLSYVSLWRLTAVRWDPDSDGEANGHLFKVEGYIMEDEDQDGTPEVQWHVEYEGNGDEEEP